MGPGRLTRRELARDVVLTATSAALLASPPALAETTTTITSADQAMPPPTDAELIGALVSIELLVEFVYRRALRSGRLSRRLRRAAAQIADHERAHARALAAVLLDLGSSAPGGPDGDGDAEAALAQHHVQVNLAKVESERDWLRLMLSVEDVLERNYHAAIAQLRRARLLSLAARIMASEAQHSAVLGHLLHPGDIKKAVPNAFVSGT